VRHLKLAAVLALALLTAGQLTLHNHSLIPESGAPALVCGVCAFNADRTTPIISVAVSLVVAWELAATIVTAAASGTPSLLPSRAPPAVI